MCENERGFFVFGKKMGEVVSWVSEKLGVWVIFCMLGNEVKIWER